MNITVISIKNEWFKKGEIELFGNASNITSFLTDNKGMPNDIKELAYYVDLESCKNNLKNSVGIMSYDNLLDLTNDDFKNNPTWESKYKYKTFKIGNDYLVFSQCLVDNIAELRDNHYNILVNGIIKENNINNIDTINILAHRDDFNTSKAGEIIKKDQYTIDNIKSDKINKVTFSHSTSADYFFNDILNLIKQIYNTKEFENLYTNLNKKIYNYVTEDDLQTNYKPADFQDKLFYKEIEDSNGNSFEPKKYIKHHILTGQDLLKPEIQVTDTKVNEIRTYLTKEQDETKEIIHTAYYSFYDFFKEGKTEEEIEDFKRFDPLINYFDSNISVSYKPILKDEEGNYTLELKQISNDQDLLQLNVVKEYAEYHQRKFKAGYLKAFKGGHAAQITPFQFHSEQEFKRKCEQQLKKLQDNNFVKWFVNNKQDDHIWRVVLCDDFSNRKLNIGDEEKGLFKRDIVTQVLNKLDDSDIKLKNLIKVETASSIKNLIASKENSADIILLDYLFNNHKEEAESSFNEHCKCDSKKLHYGTDFFKRLKHSECIQKDSCEHINYQTAFNLKKAPLNKYWIIPISSFSQSMRDEMQNSGISTSDTNFEFSRGACLINTPYLFLYELLFMMNVQLDTIFNKIKYMDLKIKELLKNSNNDSDKNWINEFSEISQLTAMLNNIKKDETSSFSKKMEEYFISNILNKLKRKLLNHYREYAYQKAFHSAHNNETIIIEFQKMKQLLNQIKNLTE